MNPIPFETVRADLLRLRRERAADPMPEVAWLDAEGIEGPEERLRWLLLRCALDQGSGVRLLDRLCSRLRAAAGTEYWGLPAPRQAALEEALRAEPALERWTLARRFCGVVWSAGEFVRSAGPLVSYLRKSPDEALSGLSEGIFWFGRRSEERFKGRRFLALAAAPAPWGLGRARPAGEWSGWTFPLWEGSLEFWSAHRLFWNTAGERLRRIDVARRLSALFAEIDPSAPNELACAARWAAREGIR